MILTKRDFLQIMKQVIRESGIPLYAIKIVKISNGNDDLEYTVYPNKKHPAFREIVKESGILTWSKTARRIYDILQQFNARSLLIYIHRRRGKVFFYVKLSP